LTNYSDGGMYVLLILMMVGFLAMDVVYVAVVLNYCTQCQLIIFFIRGLNERIEEKSISLHQIIRVLIYLQVDIRVKLVLTVLLGLQ
jgi:hypothetical protein